MSKQSTIAVSLDKLNTLREELKSRPSIQIGVFANKTTRKDDMTNATLASIHENGDSRHGLPARSMLKVPIKDHAKQIMASIAGMSHQLIMTRGMEKMWRVLGIAAEKIVLQAFQTEGFGKWAPLQYATVLAKLKGSLTKRRKILGQIYTGEKKSGILIATGQLRRAFSSRVIMKY